MLLEDNRPSRSEGRSNPFVLQDGQDYRVQQFRFVPDTYFKAVGRDLDPGLDRLVYLRLFVEEETHDEF
jgi:hypothetical protein